DCTIGAFTPFSNCWAAFWVEPKYDPPVCPEHDSQCAANCARVGKAGICDGSTCVCTPCDLSDATCQATPIPGHPNLHYDKVVITGGQCGCGFTASGCY